MYLFYYLLIILLPYYYTCILSESRWKFPPLKLNLHMQLKAFPSKLYKLCKCMKWKKKSMEWRAVFAAERVERRRWQQMAWCAVFAAERVEGRSWQQKAWRAVFAAERVEGRGWHGVLCMLQRVYTEGDGRACCVCCSTCRYGRHVPST